MLGSWFYGIGDYEVLDFSSFLLILIFLSLLMSLESPRPAEVVVEVVATLDPLAKDVLNLMFLCFRTMRPCFP
jgi:hypothetical protein